jgi:hypothetical protein
LFIKGWISSQDLEKIRSRLRAWAALAANALFLKLHASMRPFWLTKINPPAAPRIILYVMQA